MDCAWVTAAVDCDCAPGVCLPLCVLGLLSNQRACSSLWSSDNQSELWANFFGLTCLYMAMVSVGQHGARIVIACRYFEMTAVNS